MTTKKKRQELYSRLSRKTKRLQVICQMTNPQMKMLKQKTIEVQEANTLYSHHYEVNVAEEDEDKEEWRDEWEILTEATKNSLLSAENKLETLQANKNAEMKTASGNNEELKKVSSVEDNGSLMNNSLYVNFPSTKTIEGIATENINDDYILSTEAEEKHDNDDNVKDSRIPIDEFSREKVVKQCNILPCSGEADLPEEIRTSSQVFNFFCGLRT